MVQEQTSVPSATGRGFSAWREGLQMALRDAYCDALLCPALRAKPTCLEHRRKDAVDPSRSATVPAVPGIGPQAATICKRDERAAFSAACLAAGLSHIDNAGT